MVAKKQISQNIISACPSHKHYTKSFRSRNALLTEQINEIQRIRRNTRSFLIIDIIRCIFTARISGEFVSTALTNQSPPPSLMNSADTCYTSMYTNIQKIQAVITHHHHHIPLLNFEVMITLGIHLLTCFIFGNKSYSKYVTL